MKKLKFLSSPLGFALLCTILITACRSDNDEGDILPGEVNDPTAVFSGIFYALSDDNMLYELDAKSPEKALRSVKIETKEPGERIIAIDFRPSTGQLYALSNFRKMYWVNVNHNRNGIPNVVNLFTSVQADLSVNTFGFDFDPVTDRIRLVTDKGENVILEPRHGQLNKDFAYPFGIATPNVGGVAYSNNYHGATSSILYGIDVATDQLVRYETPAADAVNPVGGLGEDIAEVGGFDIAPKKGDKEFAIASVRKGDTWELDHVDLKTGRLTPMKNAWKQKFIGIAIPTPVAFAVTKNNTLLIFDPTDDDPQHRIIEKPIRNLGQGARILGIEMSVSHYPQLHLLGSNSTIYDVNPGSGEVVYANKLDVELDLEGSPAFGFDHDPYANYFRISGSNYSAYSVGREDTEVIPDKLLYLDGKPQRIDALAYSNNQFGLKNPDETSLYGIDSESGILYKRKKGQSEIDYVGNLKMMIDKSNGFDIGGTQDRGYGLFTVGGKTKLYQLSLENASIIKTYSEIPHEITGFTLGFYLYNDRDK